MKYAPALALMLALGLPASTLAQVETETRPPVVPTDVTPTQGAPNTPLDGVLDPATTVEPAPIPSATVDTQSPQAFLNSLATKFGTKPKKLQALLAKLPPKGAGLSSMEIAVIAAKLKLTKEERSVLKSRIGKGGTGFTHADAAGMGLRLGLSDAETARLAQQLGIVAPSVAGSTTVPASY